MRRALAVLSNFAALAASIPAVRDRAASVTHEVAGSRALPERPQRGNCHWPDPRACKAGASDPLPERSAITPDVHWPDGFRSRARLETTIIFLVCDWIPPFVMGGIREKWQPKTVQNSISQPLPA